MNKGNPYLVAITGSFGTGKSIVGDLLSELGFCVVDTDKIVHNILSSQNDLTSRIVQEFGEDVINAKTSPGYINRSKLASIVFKDEAKRKKLEEIIHPEVRNRVHSFIVANAKQDIIFILIPLLFETGVNEHYDESWCIVCNETVQLERAHYKGVSLDDAKQRIASQFPQEVKAQKADYVINNSGDASETKKQILSRLEKLKIVY